MLRQVVSSKNGLLIGCNIVINLPHSLLINFILFIICNLWCKHNLNYKYHWRQGSGASVVQYLLSSRLFRTACLIPNRRKGALSPCSTPLPGRMPIVVEVDRSLGLVRFRVLDKEWCNGTRVSWIVDCILPKGKRGRSLRPCVMSLRIPLLQHIVDPMSAQLSLE